MNINDTSELLSNLSSQTDKKSEKKIYSCFIRILKSLKNRELTEQQVNSIEHKLDSLDLSAHTGNRKKYIKRKLNEFTTYLNNEFSFITAGYYTNTGMVYGMIFGSGIGLALGTAFGAGTGTAIGLSIGTGVGMVFGMMFGAAKDAEAKKENRVLT